jgi:hypothetical protein
LREAAEVTIYGTKVNVLTPEHLMATALSVGRPKDRMRIEQFMSLKVFDPDRLKDILMRHELQEKWRAFCHQTGVDDPLEI